MLHSIIDEIVVFTCSVKKTDKVSGQKKANQEVPFKLEIMLKLPQEFLADLVAKMEEDYRVEIEKQRIDSTTNEKPKKTHEELLVKNHTW